MPKAIQNNEVSSSYQTERAAQLDSSSLIEQNKSGKNLDPYKVELSQDLKNQYEKAFTLAKESPEIREERVAALQEQLRNGTYQLDSGKIADGMLREAIRERLATDSMD